MPSRHYRNRVASNRRNNHCNKPFNWYALAITCTEEQPLLLRQHYLLTAAQLLGDKPVRTRVY
jgi:hypothetical protein